MWERSDSHSRFFVTMDMISNLQFGFKRHVLPIGWAEYGYFPRNSFSTVIWSVRNRRILFVVNLVAKEENGVRGSLPAMATPSPPFGHPNLNGFPSKLGVAKGGFTTFATAWPPLFLCVGHPLATPWPPLAIVILKSWFASRFDHGKPSYATHW